MTSKTSAAANTDPYLWVGPSSGSWNDRANWQDASTDATGVPNGHNAVAFGVDTPAQQTEANDTVTGAGRAASLVLYGNLTLSGSFVTTGALDLFLFYQPSGNTYLTSTLTVTGAGDSLQARSADAAGNLAVNDGAAVSVLRNYEIASGAPTPNPAHYENYGIRVDGTGSRVTIAGLLSTDNASDLLVTDGGYLQARRMVLDNTFPVGAYAVDARSTIEVGTLGNAVTGTWTVDPGRTLTIEKGVRLNAPEYVVNGVIDDVGGLDLLGSPGNVTGTGRIKIEADAGLVIGQSGDQLSTVFKGNGAELYLADGTAAFTSTIRQFTTGESIVDSGDTFDSAIWKRGVLSLFEGTTLVGTLNMAGSYWHHTFSVSNDTITLNASSSTGSAAARSRKAKPTPRALQLFSQAMASFEQQTPALHEVSAAETQHAAHPVLAAVAR